MRLFENGFFCTKEELTCIFIQQQTTVHGYLLLQSLILQKANKHPHPSKGRRTNSTLDHEAPVETVCEQRGMILPQVLGVLWSYIIYWE